MFYVFAENIGSGNPEVFPPNTAYAAGKFRASNSDTADEVKPLRYQIVEVDAKTTKAGTATVTITGAALSSAVVYVYAAAAFPPTGDVNPAPPDTAPINVRLASAPAGTITIKFLGPPVTTAADETTNSDLNVHPEPRSNLTANLYDIGSIDSSTGIVVTAAVKDQNGDNLKGKITYTVEFMEGSALQSGYQGTFSTPPMDFDADDQADPKGTTYKVRGWDGDDKADGPVIVNVTATFRGDTGVLEMPLVMVDTTSQDGEDSELDKIMDAALTRVGPLDGVTVEAVCYAPATGETPATDDQAKVCGEGANADTTPATVDMRQRTVFEVGHKFTVKTKAVDALGSSTTIVPTVKVPDTETEDGNAAFSVSDFVVTIDGKAPAGKYDLTIEAEEGSIEKSAMASFVVSGEVAMYEIIGPENIALASFSSAEYTVKATDMQGNPPNFKKGEDMVLVVIESDHSLRVTGLEDNMAMLDHETGTDTFTVYKPAGAQSGDTASIGIFVDNMLQDSTMVSFGDAPTAPGMPMNVMAEATSHDMITVSWDAADDGGSDITGYVLQRKYGMEDFMTIAATDAATWWDTLDCEMMNAAIPDDADPAPAEDDTDMTSPYCAMYAGLSDDAEAVVDGVFSAKYGMISGTSYSDTGLMADTEYSYRVQAANATGYGAWSATVMETTEMAPIPTTAPMAYGMLDAVMLMVGDDAEMVDVSGAFMEADGDDVTYTAMSDDDMVATAMADGSMVSIMAMGAGSATVTVTATDKDGSATQDISVTVNATPVASYAIAVPDRIKADMTETITITAQDANGNATAGGHGHRLPVG